MPGTLEILLRRIRDGLAGPGEIAAARQLALHDARLPEELRGVVLQDDAELAEDAAGVLSVLGADDLFGAALLDAIRFESGAPGESGGLHDEHVTDELVDDASWIPYGEALAGGLRAEAEGFEVADAVGQTLQLEPGGLGHGRIEVGPAVLAEAGPVELGVRVLAALGFEAVPVAAAVHHEMARSETELADRIVASLGIELALVVEHKAVAEAVRREAGACDLSAAVMQALDAEVIPVREAVLAGAGEVDLSTAIYVAVGGRVDPVADAVRAEAGAVDVLERVQRTLSPEVMAGVLDHQLDDTTHRLAAAAICDDQRSSELTAMAELATDVRSAIREEAGAVSLWAAIAGEIGIAEPEHVAGWDATILAEAVRHEAGTVEVRDAVMREVRRFARPVLPRPVLPSAEMPLESLPPAANRGNWGFGGLLMAALVVLVIGLRGFGSGYLPVDPAGSSTAQGMAPVSDLTFASAEEVVVEDLQYGADVSVFQTEGEGGAMIIWVDEEAVL